MLRVDRKIISRKRHLHQLLGQKEIATISNHCPRVWAEERGCTGFYMFQNVRHLLIICIIFPNLVAPPLHSLKSSYCIFIEAELDNLCRFTAHDSVWRHILGFYSNSAESRVGKECVH